MTAQTMSTRGAYEAFGLKGDEDFTQVRARFRERVKQVHPDTAGSEPGVVLELQRLLVAYEVLRVHAPRLHDYEITPEEARKGGLRTIKADGREAMVRIPVGVKNATVVTPIGDSKLRIKIVVRDKMLNPDLGPGEAERKQREQTAKDFEAQSAHADIEETAGLLKGFYETFVKKSPAARLVSWAKRGAA